jgi:hypothetical protein
MATKTNQKTREAGLSFNVNSTKNWIKKQFTCQNLEIPKFRNSHVGLTAVIESLILNILHEVKSQIPKDKSSLYKITLPVLSYTMQLNDNYNKLFNYYFSKYNSDMNYTDTFWITQKDIKNFIEHSMGDNIQLDAQAYNFLAFLLMTYSSKLVNTANSIIKYVKKSTLDAKAIRTAVEIHTPDNIANYIYPKFDEAITNNTEEKSDDEGDKDDDNDTETVDKKKKNDKDKDDETETVDKKKKTIKNDDTESLDKKKKTDKTKKKVDENSDSE